MPGFAGFYVARQIKIVQGITTRLHLFFDGYIINMVAVAEFLRIGRVIRDLAVARKHHVRPPVVGQLEDVSAVLVGKEVVHALLLHQPAHEIEIGFAVLDAVFPGAIAAAQAAIIEVVETVIAEDLRNDVRDGHALKIRQSAVRVRNHSHGLSVAR